MLSIADGAPATTRTWQALVGNVGSMGSNGTARLTAYWTGTGRLELRLRRLTPGLSYTVVLYRGPKVAPGTSWSGRGRSCAAVSDGTLVRLSSIRPMRDGTATRTVNLSSTQVTRLAKYPRTLAIAVGSGPAARCGGLVPGAAVRPTPAPVPSPTPSPPPGASPSPPPVASPSPGASPSPSPVASPSPEPTCAAWPDEIDEVLAVLSTPADLCLVTFQDASQAPAFIQATGAMYLPAFSPGDRPTVFYLVGAPVGTAFHALAHEVCHAHQDRVARDAGQTGPEGWYLTAPGVDFVAATGWSMTGNRWVSDGSFNYASPLEDNADTCAIWFDRSQGPRFLRRWVPSRFGWAQRWLPLPSWITPWQPGGDGSRVLPVDR